MFAILLAASLAADPAPDAWYAAKVTVKEVGFVRVGSGTPVVSENGRTLILTNAHVVRGEGDISVRVQGKDRPAKYVAGSKVVTISAQEIDVLGPDLALVEVEGELDTVRVRPEPPPVGTPVYLRGFGGTNDQSVRRAGRLLDSILGPKHLAESTPTVPGDSGAGVFDADGYLVGVRWGGTTEGSFAVPIASLRELTTERVAERFPRLTAKLNPSKSRETK